MRTLLYIHQINYRSYFHFVEVDTINVFRRFRYFRYAEDVISFENMKFDKIEKNRSGSHNYEALDLPDFLQYHRLAPMVVHYNGSTLFLGTKSHNVYNTYLELTNIFEELIVK